ncbi:MAG: DUF370 domain-containing protein [Desulfatibacillaceae bacterium]
MDGRGLRKWTAGHYKGEPVLNIGFGNTVVAARVVAIVNPNSAPMKRLRDEARQQNRLVDATCGRKTRSIIVMDSNHVVLSAIQAETISARFTSVRQGKDEEGEK